MKKINLKIIKKIENYRKKGYSYKEIAKKLDIAVGSSYKYSNKIKVSRKGIERLLDRIKSNQKRIIKKARRIKKPKQISLELVRIIGHCLFDGCVSRDGIAYSNCSINLINEFKRDVMKVFRLKPDNITESKNEHKCYIIYYNYKKLRDYLLELVKSTSYSTSKEDSKKVVDFIYNLDDKKICEFLRTFWDDEGCVKKCKDVTAKTKLLEVAKSISELHKKIGIYTNIYRDTKNDAYEIYLLKRNNNMDLFKEKVGFKHGIVSRGSFAGFTKQQVLYNIIK